MADSDQWIDNTTRYSPAREFEQATGVKGVAYTYRLPDGDTVESFELQRVNAIFRLGRTDPEAAFQQAEQLIKDLQNLNPELRGIDPRQVFLDDMMQDVKRPELPAGQAHPIPTDENPREPRPLMDQAAGESMRKFVEENQLKYILPMMRDFLRGVASEFNPGDILFQQQNACGGLYNSYHNISQHEMNPDDPRFMYQIRLDRIDELFPRSRQFVPSPDTLTQIEQQLGLPDLRTQVPESMLTELDTLSQTSQWQQLKDRGVTGR